MSWSNRGEKWLHRCPYRPMDQRLLTRMAIVDFGGGCPDCHEKLPYGLKPVPDYAR